MGRFSFVIAMIFMLAVFSGISIAQVDTEYDKGLKYYNSGKFEEAVTHFKEYVKDKPDASSYYRIGYALYKLGKHDEAYKYFDEAYLIDPDFTPGPFVKPIEEQPVEKIKSEAPQTPAVVPEEPVIQKQEIVPEEQPVEEIQTETLQVPAVVHEELMAKQ